MEWVNITAKSLPEAIDLALDNLGVDESEAEIEILEEPRQGLFGRQRGNARIRARVKPKGTRPKVERGRSRKRTEGGAAAGGSAGGGGRTRTRSAGGAGGGRTRDESSNGSAEAGAEETTVSTVPADDESAGRSRSGGRSGGGRGRGEGSGGGSGNGRSGGSDRHSREPVEEASMEEVSSQLEAFLSGLSEAFGYDGQVTITSDDDEGVLGMVDGRHGLMVGPKARTLDAIQELARVSVQRTAPSNIRIKVDVGGYREVRKEALRAFALEAAAAVRLDGRERLLEPMSSADRKVVHDALSGEPGIETRSAGNEPYRRVVVLLAEGSRAAAAPAEVDADDDAPADEVISTNGSGPAAEAPVDEAVDAGDDAVADAAVADDAGADDAAEGDDAEGENVES